MVHILSRLTFDRRYSAIGPDLVSLRGQTLRVLDNVDGSKLVKPAELTHISQYLLSPALHLRNQQDAGTTIHEYSIAMPQVNDDRTACACSFLGKASQFARAAKELEISQPTLTRGIQPHPSTITSLTD
jgi:hypothetical protein